MKQKEMGMVIMIAFIVTVMGCEKDIPGSVSDIDRAESHLDTLGFRLLYTEQLVHCMLINDTELQRIVFWLKPTPNWKQIFLGIPVLIIGLIFIFRTVSLSGLRPWSGDPVQTLNGSWYTIGLPIQ